MQQCMDYVYKEMNAPIFAELYFESLCYSIEKSCEIT